MEIRCRLSHRPEAPWLQRIPDRQRAAPLNPRSVERRVIDAKSTHLSARPVKSSLKVEQSPVRQVVQTRGRARIIRIVDLEPDPSVARTIALISEHSVIHRGPLRYKERLRASLDPAFHLPSREPFEEQKSGKRHPPISRPQIGGQPLADFLLHQPLLRLGKMPQVGIAGENDARLHPARRHPSRNTENFTHPAAILLRGEARRLRLKAPKFPKLNRPTDHAKTPVGESRRLVSRCHVQTPRFVDAV